MRNNFVTEHMKNNSISNSEQLDGEDWKKLKNQWREHRQNKQFKVADFLGKYCEQKELLFTKIADYQYRITDTVSLKQIDIYPQNNKFYRFDTKTYHQYKNSKTRLPIILNEYFNQQS